MYKDSIIELINPTKADAKAYDNSPEKWCFCEQYLADYEARTGNELITSDQMINDLEEIFVDLLADEPMPWEA